MSARRPPRELGGILPLSRPGTPPGGGYPIYLVTLLLCLYSSDLSPGTQGNKGTVTAGWTCPGGGG